MLNSISQLSNFAIQINRITAFFEGAILGYFTVYVSVGATVPIFDRVCLGFVVVFKSIDHFEKFFVLIFKFLDFREQVVIIIVIEVLELLKNFVDFLNFEMNVVDVILLLFQFLSSLVRSLIQFMNAASVIQNLALDVFCLFVHIFYFFHNFVQSLAIDCTIF